jgi:hypothetical protein
MKLRQRTCARWGTVQYQTKVFYFVALKFARLPDHYILIEYDESSCYARGNSRLAHQSLSCNSCSRLIRAWMFRKLSCTVMHPVKREQELMRVEKREFTWEFSQLSWPGQTRTRVAWELMRVEKREFASEFSQLSCPGQTRTRVAWELMRIDSESSH